MRLTIKDLKIYRKKITTLNYNIISEKAFLKRCLQITFKNLKIGGASKI